MSDADTIIASNSSSFTIQEIIHGLELRHPQRCVSLHSCKHENFLSHKNFPILNQSIPNRDIDWPPETPAIEIMGTNITKPNIISHLIEKCKEHGFNPFHVKKNSNGYIYNRYVTPNAPK
jgi:3-hydroxyacyl-CoA dehydrogenase